MISFSESFAKLFSAVFSNRNSFLKDNMVSNFAFVKKRKTQVITVLYLKSFFKDKVPDLFIDIEVILEDRNTIKKD